jgi:hypothetical protein
MMSPHKKSSRSVTDDKAKAKVALKAAVKSKKSSQQDEKKFRNKILNHAALAVREEQRQNCFGRVGHGFVKMLIGTYHNKGLMWVTKNKIEYAVKKLKALERKIPKERSHPPVTTIHVKRTGSSSSSVVSYQRLSGAEMFDVMMGLSVSDVSSPEISVAEENAVHSGFSSETSSSSSSSTASTSSDSSESTDVTEFLKQAQQFEEDLHQDMECIQQAFKRQEKFEEELELWRLEINKRREEERQEREESREKHRQECEESREKHRQECEESREEHRKWMEERRERIIKLVGTF